MCLFLTTAFYARTEAGQYPFKSAMVKYKITGTIQNGSQTIYIDDYGAKTRKESDLTLSLQGGQARRSRLEIDDGNFLYLIDRAARTGQKSVSPTRRADELLKTAGGGIKERRRPAWRRFIDRIRGKNRIRSAGKGNILGRECDVYDLLGMKTWKWKGLTLRKESPALGDMVQEATEVSVDSPIPPSMFVPPADIVFERPATNKPPAARP